VVGVILLRDLLMLWEGSEWGRKSSCKKKKKKKKKIEIKFGTHLIISIYADVIEKFQKLSKGKG
jgi:hypothetical protein